MILILANISTLIAALIFFAFGIIYFYKSKSLKNHCNTIQNKLEDANIESRILLFALMRGAGGGAIGIAVLTCWLQLQYSKHAEPWEPLAIVIANLLFYLPSLNAMLLVKSNTKIKPPVFILSLAMLFIIIGYVLNIKIINQ